MAYCKKCNKEISAIEDNIYSGYCENCYEELQGKNQKTDNYTRKNNLVATILKSISIIIAVICIIGFIVGIVTEEIEEIADATSIITAVICSIFIYGFGEIIQLLDDIKNK